MSEAAPPTAAAATPSGAPAEAGAIELTPAQIEQLTELVYRLIKQETLLGRERHGDFLQSRWR